jgi:hypothetical protein
MIYGKQRIITQIHCPDKISQETLQGPYRDLIETLVATDRLLTGYCKAAALSKLPRLCRLFCKELCLHISRVLRHNAVPLLLRAQK